MGRARARAARSDRAGAAARGRTARGQRARALADAGGVWPGARAAARRSWSRFRSRRARRATRRHSPYGARHRDRLPRLSAAARAGLAVAERGGEPLFHRALSECRRGDRARLRRALAQLDAAALRLRRGPAARVRNYRHRSESQRPDLCPVRRADEPGDHRGGGGLLCRVARPATGDRQPNCRQLAHCHRAVVRRGGAEQAAGLHAGPPTSSNGLRDGRSLPQ